MNLHWSIKFILTVIIILLAKNYSTAQIIEPGFYCLHEYIDSSGTRTNLDSFCMLYKFKRKGIRGIINTESYDMCNSWTRECQGWISIFLSRKNTPTLLYWENNFRYYGDECLHVKKVVDIFYDLFSYGNSFWPVEIVTDGHFMELRLSNGVLIFERW